MRSGVWLVGSDASVESTLDELAHSFAKVSQRKTKLKGSPQLVVLCTVVPYERHLFLLGVSFHAAVLDQCSPDAIKTQEVSRSVFQHLPKA